MSDHNHHHALHVDAQQHGNAYWKLDEASLTPGRYDGVDGVKRFLCHGVSNLLEKVLLKHKVGDKRFSHCMSYDEGVGIYVQHTRCFVVYETVEESELRTFAFVARLAAYQSTRYTCAL
jgi:hypothetical protein